MQGLGDDFPPEKRTYYENLELDKAHLGQAERRTELTVASKGSRFQGQGRFEYEACNSEIS